MTSAVYLIVQSVSLVLDHGYKPESLLALLYTINYCFLPRDWEILSLLNNIMAWF